MMKFLVAQPRPDSNSLGPLGTFDKAAGSANLCGVKKKVVVVDNYDSFTYNLVQYIETLGVQTQVFLNDKVDCAAIWQEKPQGILLSPGPGTPNDAGVTLSVIEKFAGEIPIFGVCLGHQSIGQAFGGKVIRAQRLMHGKTSLIHHDGKTIFLGMPQPFVATRYHSLLVDPATLGDDLVRTAWTPEGEVMGLRHRTLDVEGVQFHPESFLTAHGRPILATFLSRARRRNTQPSPAGGM